MKRRLLAILVCVAMTLGMMPAVATADEGDAKSYLALGDSISSGYGLDDKDTQSFVNVFAAMNGFEADDSLTREGLTSSDLLLMVTSEEASPKIAEADVISVAIGGNDILAALYGYLASTYNTVYPEPHLTAADVRAILAGDDLEKKNELIAFAAIAVEDFPESEEAALALESFSKNLSGIIASIKNINPDVKILVSNLYNPYAFIAKQLAGTDYQEMANAMSAAFDTGASALGAAIGAGSMTGNYIVADTYNALDVATENPCNASVTVISAAPLVVDFNLDFHPNAYGHALFANAFTYALHPSASYPDVDPSKWYIDAIDWAVSTGILGGYGDTGFMGPEEDLTRAQLAQIFWNAAQKPAADKSVLAQFSDVDPDAWYADALAWAVSNGLLLGYEGTDLMGPNDILTREQTAVVTMRLAVSMDKDVSGRADLSGFLDEDILCDWAYEAMSWAVDAGVINGLETQGDARGLAPHAACQRAQIAAILMNFSKIG